MCPAMFVFLFPDFFVAMELTLIGGERKWSYKLFFVMQNCLKTVQNIFDIFLLVKRAH
jgi:hypothetical protein